MQAGGGAGGIFRQTPCWAGAHDPWDNDSTWNKSWTLNLLGHPGAPGLLIFTFNPGSWNHCHQGELTNHGPWKGQIAGRKDQDVFCLLIEDACFLGKKHIGHRKLQLYFMPKALKCTSGDHEFYLLIADQELREDTVWFIFSHVTSGFGILCRVGPQKILGRLILCILHLHMETVDIPGCCVAVNGTGTGARLCSNFDSGTEQQWKLRFIT